jgi:hypothetical protein
LALRPLHDLPVNVKLAARLGASFTLTAWGAVDVNLAALGWTSFTFTFGIAAVHAPSLAHKRPATANWHRPFANA